MPSTSENFVGAISAILARYVCQNGLPSLTEAERNAIGARLWLLVAMHGVPARVPAGEGTSPPEMKAEEVAPLIATVLEDSPHAGQLAVPLRQLIKACFQAERSQCRESYRETRPDGTCRRQQLDRVRERVSGTHCVDCPHWNDLEPVAHQQFLADAWCGDREELARNREVFLPEDFRVLRRWLRAQATANTRGSG